MCPGFGVDDHRVVARLDREFRIIEDTYQSLGRDGRVQRGDDGGLGKAVHGIIDSRRIAVAAVPAADSGSQALPRGHTLIIH